MAEPLIVVNLLPCECHLVLPWERCEVCIDRSFPRKWEDVKRQYGIGPEYEGLHLVRY